MELTYMLREGVSHMIYYIGMIIVESKMEARKYRKILKLYLDVLLQRVEYFKFLY